MRGNKGEWSEIYAFFKLLFDKKMYAGDDSLNLIPDVYYPILDISRGTEVSYALNESDNVVTLKTDDNQIISEIDISSFSSIINNIFSSINTSNSTTFELPFLNDILHEFQITRLSASSHAKQDIYIKFHDIRTGFINKSGFSIKSMLGSSSTLLNASGSTKFIFKIVGDNLSDLNSQNLRPGKETVSFLLSNNYELTFFKTSNDIFASNLMMTDYILPELMSQVILVYFSSTHSNINTITNTIESNNFLNIPENYVEFFYKYKIKQLLVNVALGMMPATVWQGNYTANGGYIIVKESGDIVCYHIYDKHRFENYLFNNIKLDTPSLSRHHCGFIYTHGNDYYIDLPLQLRFI